MDKINVIFNDWVNELVGDSFNQINELSEKLEIDNKKWFIHYLSRRRNDCTGYEIITEIFEDYIFYISRKFQEPINKYLPIAGYNIYKEPTYGLYINLGYNKDEFYFKNGDKEDLEKVLKKFSIQQKLELMENHIFSYIIKQTKFKIFNKSDVRYLKLKNINEYSEITEE